jgi:hypothetical protein
MKLNFGRKYVQDGLTGHGGYVSFWQRFGNSLGAFFFCLGCAAGMAVVAAPRLVDRMDAATNWFIRNHGTGALLGILGAAIVLVLATAAFGAAVEKD